MVFLLYSEQHLFQLFKTQKDWKELYFVRKLIFLSPSQNKIEPETRSDLVTEAKWRVLVDTARRIVCWFSDRARQNLCTVVYPDSENLQTQFPKCFIWLVICFVCAICFASVRPTSNHHCCSQFVFFLLFRVDASKVFSFLWLLRLAARPLDYSFS